MKYDLSDETGALLARQKLDHLIKKKAHIDLSEKQIKKTSSQNRYLHLIISSFALHFGLTVEETKQQIFKEIVNQDIFYEGEHEGIKGFSFSTFRSTADLTKGEKIIAINRFIKFSADQGHNLPDPDNIAHLYEIENQIESIENAKYL
jgi:hypothetical protein